MGADDEATDDGAILLAGAMLLAGAIDDAALDAGVDPPPLPPPHAVINPLNVNVRSSLDVFINRSLLII